MQPLTLFARKEPTADTVSIQHGLPHKKDTVLYRDASCTDVVARWPWHYSNCPRRGQKQAMLNCFKWNLAWVN